LEIENYVKWRKSRFVQNLVGNLLVSQGQLKTIGLNRSAVVVPPPPH
jgi:hypothetical protein